MIKVIFVCHGNYHRSPMAQGLFQTLIQDNKLQEKLFCDSAGTVCNHPDIEPHPKTMEYLEKHGSNLKHKARLFKYKDLLEFDYVIAMDHFNLRDIFYIKKVAKHTKDNIFMMRKFDSEVEEFVKDNTSEHLNSTELDVPDPEMNKLAGYENVYNILNRSVKNLFDFIRQENNF